MIFFSHFCYFFHYIIWVRSLLPPHYCICSIIRWFQLFHTRLTQCIFIAQWLKITKESDFTISQIEDLKLRSSKSMKSDILATFLPTMHCSLFLSRTERLSFKLCVFLLLLSLGERLNLIGLNSGIWIVQRLGWEASFWNILNLHFWSIFLSFLFFSWNQEILSMSSSKTFLPEGSPNLH